MTEDFMPASRNQIVRYLNNLLAIDKIKDSSCNGLQVQGAKTIRRVGLAVDACMAVYRKAAAKKCEMVIVHHGLIWNGLTSITGAHYEQVRYLVSHWLNLYAAHLPLDMHPEVGNNIMLARALKLSSVKPFGKYKDSLIGYEGVLPSAATPDDLGRACGRILGGGFSSLPFGRKKCRRLAIVSGGGSDAIPEAIDKGIDCFITGEPSHWNHHAALEAGLTVLYVGHYHSETPGVKAVGKKLEKEFDMETVFIDEPTLV
jgi:dinuclear metal center YbgI/SA1388 family protein